MATHRMTARPEPLKCPECVELGKRSTVHPGASTTTLMNYTPGYYDEDGEWVEMPDPNRVTTEYSCSNGHKWMADS